MRVAEINYLDKIIVNKIFLTIYWYVACFENKFFRLLIYNSTLLPECLLKAYSVNEFFLYFTEFF